MEKKTLALLLQDTRHRLCFACLFILALGLGATAVVFAARGQLSWFSLVGLVTLGVFAWTFLEYFAHRLLFHVPRSHPLSILGARHHLDHHDAPNALPITKPLYLTLPALLLSFAAAYLLWSHAYAAALWTGLATGYFFYEVHHVAAHLVPAKQHLRAKVQAHHLHHHTHVRRNFGITTQLWDRLFRTTAPSPQAGAHRAGAHESSGADVSNTRTSESALSP